MSFLLLSKKNCASVRKKSKEQFELEVICTTCKRRGRLWFFRGYKMNAHACPNCHKRTLQTPDWLNNKKDGFSLFLK